MTAPTILVTAAAGHTGTPIVRMLLERGYSVRALVRRHDHRAEVLRGAGADVVAGSLDNLDDLRRALTGVHRAYFTAPFSPWALQQATQFAIAAEENHLEAIVAMSMWLAHPTHPSAHTRNHWLADQMFAWMPTVGTVTLNPGFFAENYLAALEPIAQLGLMTMPFGEGRNAPPSNDDIARVAVAALTDPGPHLGRTYRPTGPDLLDPHQIADGFARALDRPVRYRDVPFALLARVGRTIGYTDYAMEQLRWYVDEYRADTFAVDAPTDVVATLTGRDPEPFHTIVRGYARANPRTRPGAGNLAHALAGLTRAVATRSPNLRRLVEISELAHGDDFVLAPRSREWSGTHRPAQVSTVGVGVEAATAEAVSRAS